MCVYTNIYKYLFVFAPHGRELPRVTEEQRRLTSSPVSAEYSGITPDLYCCIFILARTASVLLEICSLKFRFITIISIK